MRMKKIILVGLWMAMGASLSSQELNYHEPRLDQSQVIGTHNSYHIAPHPSLMRLIRVTGNDTADSIEYSHRPLRDQFERLGIRQIELDLFADPEGGHFTSPLGIGGAKAAGFPPVPDFDPENKLDSPGFKILHNPDFDYQTTVHTFRDALAIIQQWSDSTPNHFPLFVLLEMKQNQLAPTLTKPVPLDASLLLEVEKEILEVMDPDDILTPSDVRGDYLTLRQAILDRGWPSIKSARGKIVFCLDNEGTIRDTYIGEDTRLLNRIIFPSVSEDHPSAGFFKINDPVRSFERIQRLVSDGFIVRTRADLPTGHARRNDTSQRERAMASGAQLVSTDYPEPNLTFSHYKVQFQNSHVARTNPVSGTSSLRGIDLEQMLTGITDRASTTPVQVLSRLAFTAHNERALNRASHYYRRILEIHPSSAPTEDQLKLVYSLAPQLLTVSGEPFDLSDAVAIIHPNHPIIAYHLMWGEINDFPEDNDPVDHEVVWVQYDPDSLKPEKLFTYFHGRIIEMELSRRPVVGVEWGKHGSLPLNSNHTPASESNSSHLKRNWNRLHTSGTRLPHHPLASAWPKKYLGSFAQFSRFEIPVNMRRKLKNDGLIRVGVYANAIMDQELLPYNFSAKIEWPDVGHK